MSTNSSSSSLASVSRPSRRPGRANGSSAPPLSGQRKPLSTPASPLGRPQAPNEPDPAHPPSADASGSDADDEEPQKPSPPLRQGSDVSEDITQKEDVQPDERVTAFWETIGAEAAAFGHAMSAPALTFLLCGICPVLYEVHKVNLDQHGRSHANEDVLGQCAAFASCRATDVAGMPDQLVALS